VPNGALRPLLRFLRAPRGISKGSSTPPSYGLCVMRNRLSTYPHELSTRTHVLVLISISNSY
jgi:hypothetical protein